MTITDEELSAAVLDPRQPARLIDPKTAREFVLIPADYYSQLLESHDEIDVRDFYAAADQAFAELWNDPKMDDYDRYDELRK